MSTIGFIGGGNMAEALLRGIVSAKLFAPRDVLVSDIRKDRLGYLKEEYGVTPTGGNVELTSQVDVLILSVKPQKMDEVLGEIKGTLKDTAVVISIAAGITIEKIARRLGDVPIIRAMPNTPAMVDQGATAIVARNTSPDHLTVAREIFTAVGKVEVLQDESLMDAVTAVSGSGPAYFFLLMEEMIRVAEEMGLPSDVASGLVCQTAKGASILAETARLKNETPAQLRAKVTSPGGTTQSAIDTLKKMNFDRIMTAALTAAKDRSKELSS